MNAHIHIKKFYIYFKNNMNKSNSMTNPKSIDTKQKQNKKEVTIHCEKSKTKPPEPSSSDIINYF